MRFPIGKALLAICLCASITACGSPSGESPPAPSPLERAQVEVTPPASLSTPYAGSTSDGHYFIRRDLGQVPRVFSEKSRARGEDVRGVLNDVVSEFHVRGEDLVFRKQNVDEQGHRHLRFQQFHRGLPVIGHALVLHVDPRGAVYAVNGNARGGILVPEQGLMPPETAAPIAVRGSRAEPAAAVGAVEQVFIRPEGDKDMHLAWQVRVEGQRADMPSNDLVYVDAHDGELLAVHPRIHSALNRRVHNGNNATTLPGTLVRTEGQPEHADPVVNTNYEHLGTVYDCYNELFGRDSIDNLGGALISTVHHRANYVNAFWNGSQMVYGDGDGVTASNLATSLDVTAHELTHAVTDFESELIYLGESGGMNESMSDVFGAVCEWFGDGKVVSNRTWLVGDDVWTPSIPDDALRYMADPTRDGDSIDCFFDYSSGIDVHYSSGVPNLAFHLLSQGGSHPRGKTRTVVRGIGIEKAARIWYKANADILTANSGFEASKLAMEQAATQLGYDAATISSVSDAWKAACVGVEPLPEGPLPDPWLSMTGLAGSVGSFQYWNLEVPEGKSQVTFKVSDGTGDVDLYVNFGTPPTMTTYQCRPYLNGNNETCTFTLPQKGSYIVGLYAYSAFSGVSLTGTHEEPPPCPPWPWPWRWPPPRPPWPPPDPPPWLPIADIRDGLLDHFNYWTLDVAPGQAEVRFSLSGGTGNADLYVNRGSAPTTTAYQCRSSLGGNTETCTMKAPQAGTYYIGLRATSAYSGTTLTTTFKSGP